MWGSDGRNGLAGAGPGHGGPGHGGPGHGGPARQHGQIGQTRPAGEAGAQWEPWREAAMPSVVRRRQPEPSDALEGPYGEPVGADARAQVPGAAADVTGDFWRRHEARRTVRDFLISIPRSDPEAVLSFINARGELRSVTRAQLSAAVDRLRPRQRQVVRLGLEERWSRQRVCDYLNHISIKTFERDHLEALDILIEL